MAAGPEWSRCELPPEHDGNHRTPSRSWPQRWWRQDADGTVYLAYYVAPYGFVWDGYTSFIEVCQGGMGEPITATIQAPERVARMTATDMVEQFHQRCLEFLSEEEMD